MSDEPQAGTIDSFRITEAEAQDLAAGYVPSTIVAMARYALASEDQDERRAARPVKTKRLTT